MEDYVSDIKGKLKNKQKHEKSYVNQSFSLTLCFLTTEFRFTLFFLSLAADPVLPRAMEQGFVLCL